MAQIKTSAVEGRIAIVLSIVSIFYTAIQHYDSRHSSRAYISAVVNTSSDAATHIELANYGATPAVKVGVLLGCSFGYHNQTAWKDDLESSKVLQQDLIGPGARRLLSCVPSGNNLNVGQGPHLENVRVIKGAILYKDVFGTEHHTAFCFFDNAYSGSEMESCPEGNVSD